MKTTTSRDAGSSVVASCIALAMAVGSAAILAIANAIWYGIPSSGGSGLSLLFIGAWVLLAWAAIVAIAVLVYLIHSTVSGDRREPLEFVLVAASIVLVMGIVMAQPLSGSASA